MDLRAMHGDAGVMNDKISEPPLNEPLIVPCLFVTGAAVERTQHVVRLVGWLATPDFGGETRERRIVVRIALPLDAARKLAREMGGAVREGH